MADDTNSATDVKTSEAEKETSQEQTFTQAQVDKMVSDKLAAEGRTAKDFEQQKAAIAAEREALDSDRNATQEQEEQAVRDNPDAIKALTGRRALEAVERKNKEDARINKAESERLEEVRQQATEEAKDRNSVALAKEYGVDAKLLLNHTTGSEEAMRELAKVLPKAETNTDETLTPDSGSSTGGASPDLTALLKVDTRKMTPNQLKAHGEAIDKAR